MGADVGVADAAVLDLDEDVVRADVAALEAGGDERFGRGRYLIGTPDPLAIGPVHADH